MQHRLPLAKRIEHPEPLLKEHSSTFDRFTDMPYLKYFAMIFILVVLSPFPGGAAADDISGKGKRLKVFVSILPTAYFVQRIGGDRIQVDTLVQPGHSPATYAPTPKQMANLGFSEIYFRIGVPFENALVPKLSRILPDLQVVDLQQNIALQSLEHPDEHAHQQGDIDPHTWLDPMLALSQAEIILNTLAGADPEGRDQYSANYRKLADELHELDRFLRKTLAPYAGGTVYVFHPAYGYFCRAYNLRQKAVTPGAREPGAQYIARLIEQAQKDRVRVIFVQPQFSDKAAKTIARSINGSVVALDPLAYDYITNLKTIAGEIAEALPEPRR